MRPLERQNFFKSEATNQNNQLRIALIAVAIALTGFLVKDISVVTDIGLFFAVAIGLSVTSSIAGFAAWKSSAEMFWYRGDDQKNNAERWRKRKDFFDTALPALLGLAVVFSFLFLLAERS